MLCHPLFLVLPPPRILLYYSLYFIIYILSINYNTSLHLKWEERQKNQQQKANLRPACTAAGIPRPESSSSSHLYPVKTDVCFGTGTAWESETAFAAATAAKVVPKTAMHCHRFASAFCVAFFLLFMHIMTNKSSNYHYTYGNLIMSRIVTLWHAYQTVRICLDSALVIINAWSPQAELSNHLGSRDAVQALIFFVDFVCPWLYWFESISAHFPLSPNSSIS